jgi:V/A-type H+-transporting ATPase subunit C
MPLFKYEAVIAKCKCLYGKLLTTKDFENLLNLKTLADIATYLHDKTAYAEFFSESSNPKNINRSKLEYYIRKSLIEDFVKIYRFLSGREHYFVNMLLAKYELEYLLKIWRYFVWLKTENNSITDDEYLLDIGILEIQMIYTIYEYDSKIDLEVLKTVSNIEQFLEVMRETDFYHIFEKHMDEDITKNYNSLEIAIYNEYYKMLYDSSRIFDKKKKKKIQSLIEADIDLINL